MKTLVITLALMTTYTVASAAEVCTVSMMGRVCYEEGSPEATAAHMKGNAAAEAKEKKISDEKKDGKKASDTNKK